MYKKADGDPKRRRSRTVFPSIEMTEKVALEPSLGDSGTAKKRGMARSILK